MFFRIAFGNLSMFNINKASIITIVANAKKNYDYDHYTDIIK